MVLADKSSLKYLSLKCNYLDIFLSQNLQQMIITKVWILQFNPEEHHKKVTSSIIW